MTDRYELASAIFGTKRAETDASSLSTSIITGTAVEDSEDGVVKIIPDGNVIAPDGEDNSIILPTSPNVKEGDNVIIISTGGTATTPIVAGASGSGDRIVSELNTLLTDVEGIETLIRETTDGVLVAKVGQTVGALVNADGSFDVVEITGWSNNLPTVGDAVSTFGESVTIGNDSGSHFVVDSRSMEFVNKDGDTFLLVKDLRDANGVATVAEKYPITGLTSTGATINTGDRYITEVTSAKIGGVSYQVSSVSNGVVYIDGSNLQTGQIVDLTLKTTNPDSFCLTFGDRSQYSETGRGSVALGTDMWAAGVRSFAQGWEASAGGYAAHAVNRGKAYGRLSHAEGDMSQADGDDSHAEGFYSTANGFASHAENTATASGSYSHAEGKGNASGYYSHAGGLNTRANGEAQTAIGKYNVADTTSLLIVGNGTSNTARSNALKLDASGNLTIAGELNGSVGWSNIVADASDVVSLLGTTAVNRATADASGNDIASTYLTQTAAASTYALDADLDAVTGKLGFTANVATLPSSGTTSWDFDGGVYLAILQNLNKASLMGAYLIFSVSGTGNTLVIEPLHAATAATLTSSGTTLTIKTTTSGTVGFVVWPLTARSVMPTAHQ